MKTELLHDFGHFGSMLKFYVARARKLMFYGTSLQWILRRIRKTIETATGLVLLRQLFVEDSFDLSSAEVSVLVVFSYCFVIVVWHLAYKYAAYCKKAERASARPLYSKCREMPC